MAAQQAGELLDRYALLATQYILGKAREFSSKNGKKLLVFLFDPYRGMSEMLKSGTRFDQEVVDYLVKERFDYFDMNEAHLRDFKKYSMPFDEYMKVYFIHHSNPRGNHFFAYSVKDTVVKWLDPKPITYRKPNPESLDFKGYISGYHRWAGGASHPCHRPLSDWRPAQTSIRQSVAPTSRMVSKNSRMERENFHLVCCFDKREISGRMGT